MHTVNVHEKNRSYRTKATSSYVEGELYDISNVSSICLFFPLSHCSALDLFNLDMKGSLITVAGAYDLFAACGKVGLGLSLLA
jgi:hypothetical protein